MRRRAPSLLALLVLLAPLGGAPASMGQGKPASTRKVLVELYTSQGCSSCPPAADLLGRLAELGYGPDRVVAVNFHVDDFNTPWPDPCSDPAYSRRRHEYNGLRRRADLDYTPMMMVDGRHPVLGSDRAKVLEALERARNEPAGVALDLSLDGAGARKSLSVKVAARTPDATGRDLIVGVALTEDPVSTRVRSGENAGRTLVEHRVARRLDLRTIRLVPGGSQGLKLPVELPPGGDPDRFSVAVFVQDRLNGEVYQAESVPWDASRAPAATAERARELQRTLALRKERRARAKRAAEQLLADLAARAAMSQQDPTAGAVLVCPDCGSFSTTTPRGTMTLPAGSSLPRGARTSVQVGVSC